MVINPESFVVSPKRGMLPFFFMVGFPKTRGAFWGVPIIRVIICLGLYWGPI